MKQYILSSLTKTDSIDLLTVFIEECKDVYHMKLWTVNTSAAKMNLTSNMPNPVLAFLSCIDDHIELYHAQIVFFDGKEKEITMSIDKMVPPLGYKLSVEASHKDLSRHLDTIINSYVKKSA